MSSRNENVTIVLPTLIVKINFLDDIADRHRNIPWKNILLHYLYMATKNIRLLALRVTVATPFPILSESAMQHLPHGRVDNTPSVDCIDFRHST